MINNVTLDPIANVYFDGKCVSHTFYLEDGTRLTAGVILPSSLTFGTEQPEVMTVQAGRCSVTLEGETTTYDAGESFAVPAHSTFEIEVTETLSYVCRYG